MNIQKMMKQAQKMQAEMAKIQEELADKTVEASVGGGKVQVTANGSGEIVGLKIAPEVVDPEDVEMLEDLILSGIKQALAESRAMSQEEMGKVTAGMGLPPGMGL